jgi:anti-anti-sigma regulatory factor
LDFSRIEYIYSSALGLLIRIHKNILEKGGALCLVNVSQRIRDFIASVNLEKVFNIYATDVEFEVSHDAVWENKIVEENPKFIAISQVENGMSRVTLSGYMIASNDLSQFKESFADAAVTYFVFDLTGLESIDSYGISLFKNVLILVRDKKKMAVAYGANETVKSLFDLLDFEEYLTFFITERQALESIGKA